MIKTDDSDFYRDPNSRALINTNVKALHDHRLRKTQASRLKQAEEDVNEIKNILLDIQKALLELGKT